MDQAGRNRLTPRPADLGEHSARRSNTTRLSGTQRHSHHCGQRDERFCPSQGPLRIRAVEKALMADARFLKEKVEPDVRAWLAQEFGKSFRSEFLPLSPIQRQPHNTRVRRRVWSAKD